MSIFLSGIEINRVSDTKFLGVIISSNLTWNKHIDVVHSKISKTIGILCKVRHLLPPLGTRCLYLSLVEPYVNYCNIVWAQADPTVCLDRLFRIQKKYCRVITFSDFRAHSEPLFKKLYLLNVYQLYVYQVAIFMYKQMNGLLPLAGSFSFVTNESVHDHFTRGRKDIHLEDHCRTKKRQLTVMFQGPRIWNSLTIKLRESP